MRAKLAILKNFSRAMRLGAFVAAAALFSGCISHDGISLKHYDECEEYYDALGIYHKDCPNMLYRFDEK